MEKTALEKVRDGAVFAKDVYAIDGKLLVKKGTPYREPFSDRFREYGVREVFIEKTEGKPHDDSHGKSHGSVHKTPLTLHKSYNIHDVINDKTRMHASNQMNKTLSRIGSVSNANIRKVRRLVESMIEELLEKKDFVFALTQMRSVDDYTYQHSVNVGVLSLMIGIDLALDKESLKALGTGAILHDIGKIMIPEEIIKKPSKLTRDEYTEVRRHTDYGYEMLRHTDISEEAALIALYHHEKFDGSGYARGLKCRDIPLFSRIVAVADVYDAMSIDRVYQKKVPHATVYKEITHQGNRHFDPQIMEVFARHLHIYPNGSGVILNTGQRGLSWNRIPSTPRALWSEYSLPSTRMSAGFSMMRIYR